MSDPLEIEKDLDTKALGNTDQHYLKTVSDLGESEEIVSSQDIYSEAGVLLLKAGSKINSKTHGTLAKHQLKDRVDNSMSVRDVISNDQLQKDLRLQIAEFPVLTQMVKALNNPMHMEQALHHVYLTDVLRNKVTIAAKTDPQLYIHSLRTSICATILGCYLGLSKDDRDGLAAAGLFHDLGYLHINQEIFDSGRALNYHECQVIHAHPIIMYMLLKEDSYYHPRVSLAVLEHHERCWGTGYPRGIVEYSSKLGAVLAMSEVIISLSEKRNFTRVMSALKAQNDLYDKQIISAIVRAAQDMEIEEPEAGEAAKHCEHYLALIKKAIESWQRVGPSLTEAAEKEPQLAKINQWMMRIISAINHTGIDFEADNPLQLLADDPESLLEIYYHLEELLFTMGGILYAIEHHAEKNPNSMLLKNDSVAEEVEILRQLILSYRSTEGLYEAKAILI